MWVNVYDFGSTTINLPR